MKLYRGDRKGNVTMPEKYPTDGLLTKQINSGDDPEPHRKYGWLNTIANHIHYSTTTEKFIYDTTQYLSFSTDLPIVMKYLSTGKNLEYEPAVKDEAEAYLFTLEIEDASLKQIEEGVYTYEYNCNYNRAITDFKFYTSISFFVRCGICTENPSYRHQLLLINAKDYLEDKQSLYPVEYSNARRDSEWLLMPLDPMIGVHAQGYQSRIPIADFWTVAFFKYK